MAKKVILVPLSLDKPDLIENDINKAIYDLNKQYAVTWYIALTKAVDANKYMIVTDIDEDSTGTVSPDIGVKVVIGSSDMSMTESIINQTLLEMSVDECHPKSFISISRASDFVYIILYENKENNGFPRVKIIGNPAEPGVGSGWMSAKLEEQDNDWDLQLYDSVVLDDNYIMMLYE